MAKPQTLPNANAAGGATLSSAAGAVHETTSNAGGQPENQVNAPVAGILNSNALDNNGGGAARGDDGQQLLPPSVSPDSPSPVIGPDGNGGASHKIPAGPPDADPPVITSGGGSGIDPPVIVPGPPPLNEIIGSDVADVLLGTADGDLIKGLDGADLIVTNGGPDVVDAGGGDDIIAIANGGFGAIDGGAGTDTLFLEGDFDLDLSAKSNAIDSIERIDLSHKGANGVALDVGDLLDVTDDGVLTVLGKPQDTVTADFTGHTVTHEQTGGFDIYTVDGGLAQLLVEHQVEQIIITG